VGLELSCTTSPVGIAVACEKMPDPRVDSSFKDYVDDERFKNWMEQFQL
jgi:hypothetical protein